MLRTFSFVLVTGALLATPFSASAQAKKPAVRSAKATPSPAPGARLVERVSAKAGQLLIPYSKYVLPNGLTLIVTEDHSDPLVHVDITYHVGSAREQIGKSGFAHFFEHMMFEGSDNAPKGTFDRLIFGSGGTLNGSTTRDRTNYYETIPSNQLEMVLWLEADRMGFLLDAVTQEKFEIQRATVKNERGQNIDNQPYGQASEYLERALYPYGHPYSWPTIGYLKDLDKSNVDDLKNFFLRWYGPNNATLTVGGDVQTAQVVKMVEKYFGAIHRGPAVQNMKVPEPVLAQDRYVSYPDEVLYPMLQMVFPSVPSNHPDELPLEALAEIIGQGNNSLLYKNLEKPQLAVEATAYNSSSELAGEFTLLAMAPEGQRLDSTEARLRRTLAEFARTGPSAEAIQRFKANREAQLVGSLASVSGKVSRLAANQTFTGNPNYLVVKQQRLQALTAADVQRVFTKYVQGKHAVVLSVVPSSKPELVAHADNYTVNSANYRAPKDEYAGLTYQKARDTFDRSQRPQPGPNPVVQVPVLWQDTLANGLKIIGTRNTEIPSVTLLLSMRGGHRLQQANLGQAGLADLTARMLNEGTQQYTGEEFSAMLTRMGSTVSASADDDRTLVYVKSLTKNLPATLALLQELLLHPRFAQADFDRLKQQTLQQIADQTTQPGTIADKVYGRLLYGPASIMSVFTSGTAASVSSLTLDDVKRFYQLNYAPNVGALVVVGDVTEAEVLPQLAFLKAWPRQRVQMPPTLAALPQPDKARLYFVAKPGAPQSEIRVGYLSELPYDATGPYYRAYLANYPLGGAFNSRLNSNLREKKGYTYGAFSSFQSTFSPGPFTAQASVRADATAPALQEMVDEIKNFRQGITPEELARLQTSVGQGDALKYETGLQKALFLNRLLDYNLPPDYVTQQAAILKSLTQADVQAAARQYLPENLYYVVVGDKAQLPALQTLGYEIVELDINGEPLAVAPVTDTVAPTSAEPPVGKQKTKRKK
ncbi:insulinase family protein [Hymenobacter lapidiphilus]|uniref:M16 family metallopeptidase n=1 Tax=Hymenobacter sp. CCM 8763 TaxID=2303334 RepID=UPI000E341885|nr:pitrilysin family protein [Hymenobacter sp. CCM 8763]RFP64661.1 insulinase family protein [Hymenobacter sp. CCM 8763]